MSVDTASNAALDKEQVRHLVADILDLDPERVTDRAHFTRDLQVDSLMGLEVVVAMEKRYRIRISEQELKTITCLDDAYRILVEKLR